MRTTMTGRGVEDIATAAAEGMGWAPSYVFSAEGMEVRLFMFGNETDGC